MEKKKEQAKVLSQEMLADGIYSLWIETEAARTARPGQFVSVYTADASKLLPRPISICEIDKEGKKIKTGIPCNRRKDRNKTVLGIKGRRYCAGDRTSGKWISI